VTRLGCSTLLLNSKAPEQMITECWCWRPWWNRLASSTSCFGSSAFLQSFSSVVSVLACSLCQVFFVMCSKTLRQVVQCMPFVE